MANGSGTSGEPRTRDAVQADREEGPVDGFESCEKIVPVQKVAKEKTMPTTLIFINERFMELTRLVRDLGRCK